MKTFTPVTSRIQTITFSLGRGSLQDTLCPVATMLGQRLALLALFLCAALLAQPCAATPFQWEFTGSSAQTQDPTTPAYDAVRDFSITSNPNGVWSYGWQASLGSALNLYTVTDTTSVSGISAWLAQGTYFQNPPYVAHNDTNEVICPGFCVPPKYLHLHPGINNEVTVVRWTAPTSGRFNIEGAAVGLEDTTNATTTLYVLLNSGRFFYGTRIDNYRSPFFFRLPCALAMSAGDTLDFAVDWGEDGNYNADSTGIQFKVFQER